MRAYNFLLQILNLLESSVFVDIPANREDFELEDGGGSEDGAPYYPTASPSSPRGPSSMRGFPFEDDSWNEDIRAAFRSHTRFEKEYLDRVPPLPPSAETWALRLNTSIIRDVLKILANMFLSTRRTNAVNAVRDTLYLLAQDLPSLLSKVLETDSVCHFYYNIIMR